MHPPRYAVDDAALARLGGQARLWRCPHCGRTDTFNAHGSLRGVAVTAPGKDALRGRRFFCSNRGRRPGCGRTWSVLLPQVLRHASVRTASLWRFCRGWLAGQSILAAWEQAQSGFSLESAYRWWRRWRAGEPALRTLLWRGREPPGSLLAAIAERYGPGDPLADFQAREQRVWPGFGS